MTRVLHVGMLYPPHIMGGAERSVSILAEAMVVAGHDVAACCLSPAGWVKESRNGVTVYRIPHETDFWPEEWPQHSKLARGWRRFKQQFNYRLEKHFLNVIDDFRPDIVHTHSLVDVSTRVWVAAKSRGLPVIHTLRDFDLLCGNAAMFLGGKRCDHRHLKCQVFTFMKERHHTAVDAVAGVGADILKTHLAHGYFSHVPKELRRVVWNPAFIEGIDATYKKPMLDESEPLTFGYLGRINIEKGVGTLLDACRQLPRTGWKLLVAGKEVSEGPSLKERAQDLPVEFVGFVQPREFFESIDTLVVPSIWAEPLPRTILESYFAGVPVIGADSGGIPDLIGHENADWLYPPGNAEALANRMLRVMKAGRASLPAPETFNHVIAEIRPSSVAARYLTLYNDLKQSRP